MRSRRPVHSWGSCVCRGCSGADNCMVHLTSVSPSLHLLPHSKWLRGPVCDDPLWDVCREQCSSLRRGYSWLWLCGRQSLSLRSSYLPLFWVPVFSWGPLVSPGVCICGLTGSYIYLASSKNSEYLHWNCWLKRQWVCFLRHPLGPKLPRH